MRPAETRDKLLRLSKRHQSLALQYMLRNFVPGDGRGVWQRQAVHARVTVCRTIMGCADYVRGASQTRKKRI